MSSCSMTDHSKIRAPSPTVRIASARSPRRSTLHSLSTWPTAHYEHLQGELTMDHVRTLVPPAARRWIYTITQSV